MWIIRGWCWVRPSSKTAVLITVLLSQGPILSLSSHSTCQSARTKSLRKWRNYSRAYMHVMQSSSKKYSFACFPTSESYPATKLLHCDLNSYEFFLSLLLLISLVIFLVGLTNHEFGASEWNLILSLFYCLLLFYSWVNNQSNKERSSCFCVAWLHYLLILRLLKWKFNYLQYFVLLSFKHEYTIAPHVHTAYREDE